MNDHRLAAFETHPSEKSIMSGTQNNRMSGRASGRRRGRHLLLGIALLALVMAVPAPADNAEDAGTRTVVVTAAHGDASLSAAISAVGGDVVAKLPLARSVVVKLPQGANLPPNLHVTEDRSLSFASLGTQETSADTAASSIRATLGLARTGTEGDGVTVALVDTGVATIPALEPGIVARVDVTGSGESDGFGHGTFMAGLIRGTDDLPGVAPSAGILDVKVAGPDGRTSLVAVLTGLQTVADEASRFNVRVLNLALSSSSPLPAGSDPLVRALEGLWHMGIMVVTPAGNGGPARGSVTSPGNARAVLTAGGLDEMGTAAHHDDVVPPWSGRGGMGEFKPDLVAPAVSVISLRADGSVIDRDNPSARIGADHFRGSGTSMATAVASGAAAAVISARPDLTPADVKAALVSSTYRSVGLSDPFAVGAGGLDLAAALTVAVPDNRSNSGRPDLPPHALAPDTAGQWSSLSWKSLSWKSLSWKSLSWKAEDWASLSWKSSAWAGLWR